MTDWFAMNSMDNMDSNGTWKRQMLPEADFGPSAKGGFDFTLTFEGAILSIVPPALFLLLAPQRLFWLMKQPYKVTKSRRTLLKLVCSYVPCPSTRLTPLRG